VLVSADVLSVTIRDSGVQQVAAAVIAFLEGG